MTKAQQLWTNLKDAFMLGSVLLPFCTAGSAVKCTLLTKLLLLLRLITDISSINVQKLKWFPCIYEPTVGQQTIQREWIDEESGF